MILSLRLRLMVAFLSVIVITLTFASVGAVVLLREQQTEFARQRYGRLVDPFALRVQQMERAGYPLFRIRSELSDPASYYEVRLLLLDGDNQVVLDTAPDEEMLGVTLAVDQPAPAVPGQPYRAWLARWQQQDLYLFVSNSASPPRIESEAGSLRLVIAVPASDVTAAWELLFPRQLWAGSLAFVVAVLLSIVVAGRITQPVRAMTRASEAIAEGHYDQRIEVSGRDEIAQLSRAFNRMASEVGRNQRAMWQLVANMTHDLKTPLTSIGGFSQAIAEGLPEDVEEYRRLGQVINDEAGHMGALVDDLLYLSRIDSGQLALNVEGVNVDDLVSATADRFGFQAEAGGVEIRRELRAGEVRGDGRRLEQVFTNLLENAIRFAPRGTEVLLRSYRYGPSAVIEVHNGGEPIAPEALPHVFDRFFQGDPSRRRGGHQGLGLAIVHELVQAHGGTVAVQSASESGTTFTVRLPVGGPPIGGAEDLAPRAEDTSEASTLRLEPESAT